METMWTTLFLVLFVVYMGAGGFICAFMFLLDEVDNKIPKKVRALICILSFPFGWFLGLFAVSLFFIESLNNYYEGVDKQL